MTFYTLTTDNYFGARIGFKRGGVIVVISRLLSLPQHFDLKCRCAKNATTVEMIERTRAISPLSI